MKQNKFEGIDWTNEFTKDTAEDQAIKRLFIVAGAGAVCMVAIAVLITLLVAI